MPASTNTSLILGPDDELTFVPADPGRQGTFAVWVDPTRRRRRTPSRSGTGPTVELALPAGEGVRRRSVAASHVPVQAALAPLADASPHLAATASASAWIAATHLALHLVARGRLLPGASPSGLDLWRVGPLDAEDHARLAALAAVFPATAHCTVLAGRRRLEVREPLDLLMAYCDSVADTLVRTPLAPVAAGFERYATASTHRVDDLEAWLAEVGGAGRGGSTTGLRLTLPDGPDGTIEAVVQLRSVADPSLVVDASALWDAPGSVVERLGGDPEAELLVSLRRAARVWEPLGRLLDVARPEVLRLTDAEAEELLGDAAVALAGAGVEVQWPRDLVTGALRVRAVTSTQAGAAPAAVVGSGINLAGLLDVQFEALLDGLPLTRSELHQLAEAKRPLVRLRGQWVVADPTVLSQLRKRPQLRAGEVLAAALSGRAPHAVGDIDLAITGFELTGAPSTEASEDGPPPVQLEVAGVLATLAAQLRDLESTDELPEPDGLDASLRHYQRRGLAWLATMCELGLGGCLADDMGLGKTIQLLALHAHRHRREAPDPHRLPTLVICPTSLLANWEREAQRFLPGVPVRRFHGGDRSLDGVTEDEIVLCTYGVLRRDREALATVGWGLVVADEAQHVKNPMAATARELRRLPSGARVALTGTPVENRLTELWAILDWTTPGLLGPLERFRRDVATPVERDRDPDATERLAAVVRPFLLRRRKTDPGIAPELPPRTVTDHLVPLTAEQLTLYAATVRESMQTISEAEGMARRGLVLKLLTALKQICNHPAQFLGEPGPLPGRSGKLAALDELLSVIHAEGASTLVFSQYVQMVRLLEGHLRGGGHSVGILHGGTSAKARAELVDRFQAGEFSVFLLSLKAGGVGLNLTAASHVIHFDRWWNPAVEEQASDRAWRIGQDKAVQVHRLVCEKTVEDRIGEVLERKRGLAEAVVGGGETWLTELDDDALASLVALGDESFADHDARTGDEP